jgi:hypothetical protein
MRPHRLACLTFALFASLALAAEKEDDVSWIKRDKENAPPPQEMAFTLPDLAKLKEWRTYPASRAMGENRVEIAIDSISVGKDDILRYAVAIIPKGGPRNVFFEGIDCFSGRYRTYAWGTPEKTWHKPEQLRWKVAVLNVRNAWQGEILNDFCETSGGPLPQETIIDYLRGKSLPPKEL